MGFFSWNCPGCDHSIRSHHATSDKSEWMTKVVVVYQNGDRLSGTYDGYGHLGGDDMSLEGEPYRSMYHKACFTLLGEPAFSAPSKCAKDQGYFVEDTEISEPKTPEDLSALKAKAEEQQKMWDEEVREKQLIKGNDCPKCGWGNAGTFVAKLPDGNFRLRCANASCNAPRPLTDEQQTKIQEHYKSAIITPFTDDEVNYALRKFHALIEGVTRELGYLEPGEAEGPYLREAKQQLLAEAKLQNKEADIPDFCRL